MCGINGIWNFDGPKVSHHVIRKMNHKLKHRGPDADGEKVFGNVGLGHSRLSIIDLDNGKQPMSNDDKTIFITYNGEIYNYKKLRDILIDRGYKFYTNSDTEVLVKCYEEYGTKFINKLRGMFAFCIWDGRKKKLILARDRLGQKPLYYYSNRKIFAFSSEINSLISGLNNQFSIDPEGLNHYLTLDYIPAPLSIYKGIKKIPAAHFLVCNYDKLKINKYWHIDDFVKPKPQKISYEDSKEHLKKLLFEAVNIRLMSEVPLGAFLSGGIDSSIIVSIMAMQSKKSVNTFSIGLKNNESSELNYARKVSEYFGTNHTEFEIDIDNYQILPDIIDMFGEPFSDSASSLNFYVSKLAKEHITVALSGDGGDEIFAGYQWYERFLRDNYFNNNKEISKISSFLYNIWPNTFRGKKRLDHLRHNNNYQIYSMMKNRFPDHTRKQLFTKNFIKFLDQNNKENLLLKHCRESESKDLLMMMQMTDIKTYLADDINVKVDRMSMQNSIEVRSPLLDHKLIEFCLSMPDSFKINQNKQKYIIKDLFKSILPENTLSREKQGFGLPSNKSTQKNLDSLFEFSKDILYDPSAVKRGFYNYKYLNILLLNHKLGISDPTVSFNQIWNLITLELWFQNNNNNFII